MARSNNLRTEKTNCCPTTTLTRKSFYMNILTCTQDHNVNTVTHLVIHQSVCQSVQQQRSSVVGPMSVCSQVTSGSLSLSVPFALEPDELWQAGLSGFSTHGSPDQSTALFDRDAEKVPGGTREPSVTKSQQPQIRPLHSVDFLNGAHGHNRGVLAKQFL